jgi:hypothetical protein
MASALQLDGPSVFPFGDQQDRVPAGFGRAWKCLDRTWVIYPDREPRTWGESLEVHLGMSPVQGTTDSAEVEALGLRIWGSLRHEVLYWRVCCGAFASGIGPKLAS